MVEVDRECRNNWNEDYGIFLWYLQDRKLKQISSREDSFNYVTVFFICGLFFFFFSLIERLAWNLDRRCNSASHFINVNCISVFPVLEGFPSCQCQLWIVLIHNSVIVCYHIFIWQLFLERKEGKKITKTEQKTLEHDPSLNEVIFRKKY